MSVPLFEEAAPTGGATIESAGSGPTETSTASRSGRQLLTVHVGQQHTITQEDLELLLVIVQTLVLAAWVYNETIA